MTCVVQIEIQNRTTLSAMTERKCYEEELLSQLVTASTIRKYLLKTV